MKADQLGNDVTEGKEEANKGRLKANCCVGLAQCWVGMLCCRGMGSLGHSSGMAGIGADVCVCVCTPDVSTVCEQLVWVLELISPSLFCEFNYLFLIRHCH